MSVGLNDDRAVKAELTLTTRKSAESSRHEIPNSASSMHGRTLFPHGKSRGYHERLFVYFRFRKTQMAPETSFIFTHQRQALDKKRPKAKESFHDKPGDDALDL